MNFNREKSTLSNEYILLILLSGRSARLELQQIIGGIAKCFFKAQTYEKSSLAQKIKQNGV